MTTSVMRPAVLLLGATCVLHAAVAQPTPTDGEQRALARTFDEDISELEGQPLIEYSNSSTRRPEIIPEDNYQAGFETTTAGSKTSGETEATNTESTYVKKSKETLKKKRRIRPTKKSPSKTEKVFRTWGFVLKGLGVFSVLWALLVPVLVSTNSFGIVNLTKTIAESTQDFFCRNFFSLNHLNSKVDDAIHKYDSPAEYNSTATTAEREALNSTSADSQKTTAEPFEDELEKPIETTTKSTSSNEENLLTHNRSSSLTPKQESLNLEVNDRTKNVTYNNSQLDIIADEKENEIDVDRELDHGLNYIWASILDNLHRRFVSSIHHNIVTLLQRTIFPKKKKSMGADQYRYDPVDLILDLLNIRDFDGTRCRERLVCDARQLVSTLPYLAEWFRTASHNRQTTDVTRDYKYNEAASKGAARDDCTVYQCPYTSAQLVTGWL